MSTTQKPEALRLADKYEAHGFLGDHSFAKEQWCRQAAAELRRQHGRIAEMEEQMAAIGAGGVEPLRKHASQQAAQVMDAQTIKHISALSDLVRMPNAEYFADAHNAAVRHLRALAAEAKD